MLLVTLIALFVALALGAAHHGLHQAKNKKRPYGGWFSLAFILLAFLGMVVAGKAGNESLAYGFGFVLMVATPALFVFAMISVIAGAIARRKAKKTITSQVDPSSN